MQLSPHKQNTEKVYDFSMVARWVLSPRNAIWETMKQNCSTAKQQQRLSVDVFQPIYRLVQRTLRGTLHFCVKQNVLHLELGLCVWETLLAVKTRRTL